MSYSIVTIGEGGFDPCMSPLETQKDANQLSYKALGQIIQKSCRNKNMHWQPSNHIRSSSAQASSLRMIPHNLQNFEHFSIQIHRLKHNGIVFHMPTLRCLSNWPCQQQIQNSSSHSPQHLKQKQNHVPQFFADFTLEN